MMKKLLVLSLVLGMAAMTSAGLVVTDNASVAAVEGPASAYNGWLGITNNGVAFSAALTAEAGSMAQLGEWSDWGDGYLWSEFGVAGAPEGAGMVVAGNHILITLTGGQTWGTTDMGLGELALYEQDGVTHIGSLFVTPEPMTMALLGLGGLFLRRRK